MKEDQLPDTTQKIPMPPVKLSCEHKFKYLGQKRMRIELNSSMTKMFDVFYCEKCLEYIYK